MPVSLELYVTAKHHFRVGTSDADGVVPLASAAAERIERAFLDGQGAGLLHLATEEVKSALDGYVQNERWWRAVMDGSYQRWIETHYR
ncbi:MAG: hypothetical protein ACRD4G_14780 [Bryobacteraceae bacterium]